MKDEGGVRLGKIDLEQGADDDDVFLALHRLQEDIVTGDAPAAGNKAPPPVVKVQPKPKTKVVSF